MFRKIILPVILVFSSLFFMGEGFASIAIDYTPAPKLSLTGTTSGVRFDVASVLFDDGSDFSGAYLDTTTQYMSGVFYINTIGWALMSSGSYQVSLDCSTQDIKNLTTQCVFTGSGWSENIGEIGFSGVRYNPSTATLSGSITSFAGDFSVEGTILPLKPIEFNESLTTIVANHALPLSIRDSFIYAGTNAWTGKLIPSKNPTYSLGLAGSTNGTYIIDLSLADTYDMEIYDPQGSKTILKNIIVSPGIVTQTLEPTSGILVATFCSAHPTDCPDGADRQATTLERISSTAIPIANGVDTHNFTLKLRDTYGNRVITGTVEVSYTGTVSNIQIPSNILHPYGGSDLKDALIFNGDVFPIGWSGDGRWTNAFTPGVGDITYTLASNAPTDSSANIVVLDRITYTPLVGPNQILTDTTRLEFIRPYTATLNPPANLRVAVTNVFDGTFLSTPGAPENPELITLFKIGSGNLAYLNNLQSETPFHEGSPSTDWLLDYATSSHIVSELTNSPFSITGTYMPTTAYPELETIRYEGFVHYVISDNDVIYPVFSGNKAAEYSVSKVKILGQNNARSEYGTIGNTDNTRTNFINALRKNITLLNRGRTTYDYVPYRVFNGDKSINNDSFASHYQTIIVSGGDVTISNNIEKKNDRPLAIIALADSEGNGGNILINSSVTDISASLFAERAVKSDGDKQLYIYGALVSGNTLGDAVAGICPYYIVSCITPEEYDLEYLRSYDGIPSNAAINPRATDYPASSLIIEYDMRLQSDPPVGLPQ